MSACASSTWARTRLLRRSFAVSCSTRAGSWKSKPWLRYPQTMCRNIKTLFNFAPPATEEEIRAASLQFVRKLSGFNAPSQANRAAFERATADVAAVARTLMESLVTTAPPRDREVEAARAKARAAERFGR